MTAILTDEAILTAGAGLAGERAFLGELVGDQPASWDLAGEIPAGFLRELGARGILCAEVPAAYGGLGSSRAEAGELTAYAGGLCGSLRSVMTSHGMAAWTIQRLGDRDQRRRYLAELTSGWLAAIAFSEPQAGSDLSAMRATIQASGDSVVLEAEKIWVTGARYADYLLVLGLHGAGAGLVVVPASAPGVSIEPVADPLGCRAAGHARVRLDHVRLPACSLLRGGGQ